MSSNIANIRIEYKKSSLSLTKIDKDPIIQFKTWFDEAVQSEVNEVNAMNLATVNKNGYPSSRIVLLKGMEKGQFHFYTNYQSNKGKQLDENPAVALNFFWPELERQVRIEGGVEKVPAEVSDGYFQSRPKSSQIGAWASPQSAVIADRNILQERVSMLEGKHKNDEVLPRPKQWGGYAVTPFMIEFWQGRPSRLHDRILYTKHGDSWQVNRLAP